MDSFIGAQIVRMTGGSGAQDLPLRTGITGIDRTGEDLLGNIVNLHRAHLSFSHSDIILTFAWINVNKNVKHSVSATLFHTACLRIFVVLQLSS